MRSRFQRIIRAVWILWWLLLLAGWAIIPATIPDELTGDPLLATQVTYLTAWLVILVILFAWLSHRDDIGEPMRLERWLDAIIDDDDYADVRAYSGSPARYGTSRAIEKALGLKRGAGSDYAAWAARIEAELNRLSGQPVEPPGPIAVNDPNGKYTLERS